MKINEGYMPFMGYRTYYRTVGEHTDKAPLILMHGGPGSTHNYFEVLDRVAEEDGRMLVMYDQIGCGNSYVDGRPDLWKAETWVNELIALRKHLGLDTCHLLGQSWDGMLLLTHICGYEHSGVKSGVLSRTLPASWLGGIEQARMIRELPAEYQEAIKTATETGDYSNDIYHRAEEEYMLRHAAGKPDPNGPECLLRKKRTGRESYVVGWGPNEYTPMGTLKDYDVIGKLKDIKEPCLVINGGNDLCTPYIAKIMYDNIPDSRWELFRDCRHMCFVEDNERYVEVLKKWLNEKD